MKKTSAAILSLLLVISVLFFSGCEFEIGIGDGADATTQVAENGLPEGKGSKKDKTGTGADDPAKADGKGSGAKTDGGKKQSGSDVSVTLSAEDAKINKDFYTLKEKEEIEKNTGASEKRIKEGKKEEKKDDKKEEKKDEEKILTDKKYTIKGRIIDTDGVVSEYKLAQNGSKYAVITAYNAVPIGFIIGEENIYLMSYNEKSYMEIPLSLLESAGAGTVDDILKDNVVQVDKEVVQEGTEKVDGKELTFKKYEDGSVDYYSGSLLIMSKNADGSSVYYDELSAEAPDSLFVPPADYTRLPLSAENLENFTTMIGGPVDE